MSSRHDWSAFYRALCKKGPALLSGIDEAMRDELVIQAEATDDFWSEELETLLEMSAVEGDYRQGVIDALYKWRDNVAEALENFPFAAIDCSTMRLDLESEASQEIIRELVEAASPG